MGQIDKRLAELGITLPVPAKPVANYVGWVRTGNLVYTAGQVPLKDGKIDVSHAYGVGVGPWDTFTVKHAYLEVPLDQEAKALADLRAENIVIDGLVLAEADLEQVFLHIMKGEGAAVPAGVR